MLNNLRNHFQSSLTVYYLGIGRAQEFGTLTRPDARTEFEGTELLFLQHPSDSVMNEFKNYDDLLDFCKKNHRFKCFVCSS